MRVNLPPLDLGLNLDLGVDGDLLDPAEYEERLKLAFRRAAMLGAQFVQQLWIEHAQRRISRGGSGEYVRGILPATMGGGGVIRVVRDTSGSEDGDNLEWVIEIEIVNTSPHASFVEDGHGAFSLPEAMNWNTAKVKTGKNGRYVRIPFRHAAYVAPADRHRVGSTYRALRSMMSPEVYQQAKQLSRTLRRADGSYSWGDRLVRSGVHTGIVLGGGEAIEERRGARNVSRDLQNPAWKGSRWGGMFKAGAAGHSQYMTIRTITEQSKGWNIPAMPGMGIAREVAAMAGESEPLAAILHNTLSDISKVNP